MDVSIPDSQKPGISDLEKHRIEAEDNARLRQIASGGNQKQKAVTMESLVTGTRNDRTSSAEIAAKAGVKPGEPWTPEIHEIRIRISG